jgi:phospholipase/carboxylesterase
MDSSNRRSVAQEAALEGRLLARPAHPMDTGLPGLHQLNLDLHRDAWLYVPPSYHPEVSAPLVVALHGAGGLGRNHLDHLRPEADEHGILLLAPTSRESTWDVVHGGYGPDVLFIDRALQLTMSRYSVDPERFGVEGFSDGASYALSLGLTNGDLFTHILAFSPGFMAPLAQRGEPHIFISHGISDTVLPIDRCSRRLVPALQRAGYNVRFIEFTGGHTVPTAIASEGVEWFFAAPAATTADSGRR